jgi:hypothetical protein
MPDATLRQGLVHVARSFQDEGVVTIVVVRVSSSESLIYKQRHIQVRRCVAGDIQRRVFICSNGMMHPVEDEASIFG